MFKGSTSGSPVIPYNSEFSSLCYFINPYPELGPTNLPLMPLNGNPLSEDEVRTIKDWISRGAMDLKGRVKWSEPDLKKLYAVNQGCDIVTVFDAASQLPARCIEVGTKPGIESPHMVRVSPKGDFWYVIFINNNIMEVHRTSDDSWVGEVPLTPAAAGTGSEDALDWNAFVITRDGRYAYCVSWTQNGKLAKVDLQEKRLVHYIGGLYFPHGVALGPGEDKIYVAAQTGNFIYELDTAFSSENEFALENAVQNYQSSIDPHDMKLSPDGKKLWITCQASNEVRVFDLTNKQVTSVYKTDFYPQEIIYSSFTGCYYVSCTSNEGKVNIINPSGSSAVQKVSVGYQPHGIAEDAGSKLLYVLSRNLGNAGPPPHHSSQCNGRNGFVNFIDLRTNKVLQKRFELSVDPYFISAGP
jgi:DNA-binding beta-propeller fold protein YncE